MNELPSELLIKIFKYLPLQQRLSLQTVNKRWKQLIDSIEVKCVSITIGDVIFCHYKVVEKYKCNDFKHYCAKNHLLVSYVDKACEAFKKLTDLTAIVIESNNFDDLKPIILTISEYCNDIEHIEFKCKEGVLTEETMNLVLKIVGLKLKHFIAINQYRHFFNFAFGNENIQEFFEKSPNLETFVLDQKTWVDIDGIKNLPNTIKHLFIPWIQLNEQMFNSLSFQLSSLKSLEIGFIDELIFRRICETCVNLSQFLVRQLNIDSPNALLSLCQLKHLESLQLHFKDYTPNLDEYLTEICACCHLKRLLLYGVRITDKFVINLCELCPQLEVIEFDYGKREITDISIYKLCILRNIRCVSLPFTDITDESVIEFILNCKTITYLDLCGCKLSKNVFEVFSKRALQNKNQIFTLGIVNPSMYDTCEKPANLRILNLDTVLPRKK
ncbi:hypothetical protein B4U80_13405 [Leptotrombidium deliense]|uniref:F-box domain-containing protein n=1 Tax=Leptotrombidium deliense TaxID=299467 RepID=A0A443SUC3_9ACAR|nr:hypothetical protein B4U80_13405 [Leptotrombidium deliense]